MNRVVGYPSRPDVDYSVPPFVVPEGRRRFAARAQGTTPQLPTTVLATFDLLARSLLDDFVKPSLQCTTRDEYLGFLDRHWTKLTNTLGALHLTAAASLTAASALKLARRSQRHVWRRIKGDVAIALGKAAAEELEFVTESFAMAMRLAGRILAAPPAMDENQDRELSRIYARAAATHHLGFYSLVVMSCARAQPTAEIRQCVLGFFREGALAAYSAARQALDLREHEPQVDMSGLQVDQETRLLAESAAPVVEGEEELL